MAVAVKKNAYKTLLMKKRQELLASGKVEPEVLATNIRTPDVGEFALKAADQAVAAATVDLRFRLLREIDSALNRIRVGSYGVCEGCGEEILPNRLKALPWARYCLSCEEKRSNN